MGAQGTGPVFGVDGGGTGVRFRAADGANAPLWEGSGEAVNPKAVGAPAAAERMGALYDRALAALGPGLPAGFAAGCLGMAGIGRASDKVEIEALFRARTGFRGPLVLATDAEIALVGGLSSLEGCLLLAGTGSIAMARLADGRLFRSGGLGHLLGDEGSAFAIGFAALRRSLRWAEGRDLDTAMLPALLDYFDLPDPTEAVTMVHANLDKAKIAGAAALVEDFRARGDPLAAAVYAEARDELVLLAASARAQAAKAAGAPGGRPWAGGDELLFWGGLLSHNAWLRAEVTAAIERRLPGAKVAEARESAAFGACMLALEAARRA